MNYSFHSNNFDAFLIGVVGSSRQHNNSWTGVRREEWTYVRVAIIIVLSIHRIRNAEKCRRTTWFFAEILRVPIRFDSVTEFRLFVFIFIRSLLNSVSWEKICWDFEKIYFQLHILTRPYLCSFVRSFVRSCVYGLLLIRFATLDDMADEATNFESENLWNFVLKNVTRDETITKQPAKITNRQETRLLSCLFGSPVVGPYRLDDNGKRPTMKNRTANFTSFIFILALFFILVQELTTVFLCFWSRPVNKQTSHVHCREEKSNRNCGRNLNKQEETNSFVTLCSVSISFFVRCERITWQLENKGKQIKSEERRDPSLFHVTRNWISIRFCNYLFAPLNGWFFVNY
jgi:hypothetical protein